MPDERSLALPEENAPFGIPGAEFTETSLQIPEGIAFDAWAHVGDLLRRMEAGVLWWLGDWANYGERAYGEKYSQALEAGHAYQTVANAAWVARHVEPSRRRENLSFSHHAEVAKLDADHQVQYLDVAEDESWSTRELRERIRRRTLSLVSPPAIPVGQFATIVADPPWRYEARATDPTHEGRNPYPDMATEEIQALGPDVLDAAADDSVLWLWTTNAFLRDAYAVLDAWGFEERTILTWAKDRIGLGNWLRGQTEHCVLAVRGKPKVRLTNQSTLLAAPRGRHSEKPAEFFALVESLCPGPYLELFARTRRPGWEAWGNDVEEGEAVV